MTEMHVSFSVPTLLGSEPEAVAKALAAGEVGSGGKHTLRAEALIAGRVLREALFTSSCTDALLLAVMALDVGEGDEVIVPSFTFVSTALVVAARGATPVFADVDPLTLTLDPRSVEQNLTPRTRAVLTVHYGGAVGELDAIVAITREHGLALIEDAAHAYGGRFRGRALGTFGHFGAFSFDHQKNIQCGEGGALVVDDPELAEKARILREKGTNRRAFLDGHVDKYTWVSLGGHHLPADYVAAALVPQLLEYEAINRRRADQWHRYASGLKEWALQNGVRLATKQAELEHTHHIFWIVLPSAAQRKSFIAWMSNAGITTPSHYPSLAHTPAGRRYGRTHGTPVSDVVGECLVRLPLHHALTDADLDRVLERVVSWMPAKGNQR